MRNLKLKLPCCRPLRGAASVRVAVEAEFGRELRVLVLEAKGGYHVGERLFVKNPVIVENPKTKS